MEQNNLRDSLSGKLDVIDLEFDIKRLIAELNYHKSKSKAFDETIKSQQDKLEEMIGSPKVSVENGEIYKWLKQPLSNLNSKNSTKFWKKLNHFMIQQVVQMYLRTGL